jgi:DNA repair protein RecN (Recombination protein N)
MLRALSIRDFVIAERVELEAGMGFTVLTGETGAGKSILVDAIELLVGARATGAVVREGAERAELAAEFEIDPRGVVAAWLGEHGLEGDAGAVILRRTLDREGRSRSFVNGHPATLAQLREAGEWLVDIHGQHAHQSLLRAASQRELLDAHAGAEALREACAREWRAWQRLEALAKEAEQQHSQRAAERTDLASRVADLRALAPGEAEWEQLSAAQRRLAHGSALLAGAQSSLETLAEAEGAALPQLAAVAHRLRALAEHDAALQPIVDLLESAHAQSAEALRELRQYASRVDLDPALVRSTEQRLEALHAAARRYRARPEELARLLAEWSKRLAEIELATSPEALKREVEAARAAYLAAAEKLSAKRNAGAQALSRSVTARMQTLAMKGGRLSVVLDRLEEPAAHGMEAVSLQVSSHPSLPLRPLAQVASGGELSRISLAIQLVASSRSPVGTLVFDEVDAGIGGAVAQTVGRALKRIGEDRQVLCVTHLPQVAAQADQQWSVTKSDGRGGPATHIARLDRAARVEELARMLGGEEITATTRKHAAEMLDGS